TASLTASSPLSYLRENLDKFSTHLTRTQRVNVVFVGWKPTDQELADLKDNSTTQFRPNVAQKSFGDCPNNTSGLVSGFVQGINCDYAGTDPSINRGAGRVPYFEPL